MITRDYSPIPYNGGKLPLLDLLKALLENGFNWTTEMKSQDLIVHYLSRSLDNSYIVLRNVSLPGTEVTIPLILVGPAGITVMSDSPVKGNFRAQGSSWQMMNNRSGAFQVARPNQLKRTILFKRAVETYLADGDFSETQVDGILVLTNPGTHVDTIRPDVRVVLVDGLERFGTQIANMSPVLGSERRYKLIKSIDNSLDTTESVTLSKDPSTGLPQSIDAGFDQAVRPLRRKTRFSRKQWLILGAFVAIEVIVLVIFLIMIMVTA